jgi:NADH-quinone oxidoreductase subunit J
MESLLYYLLALIALLAALNVLMQRRVFYSAISLIICLTALSGIYMILDSPFIAAVQIIVYAGAIMVLFLFVIMLLDPFSATLLRDKKKSLGYFGVLLGICGIALLYQLLKSYDLARAPRSPAGIAGGMGSIRHIGEVLFEGYLLPFEMTSILILVAIIGVVVLAKRKT